MPSNDARVTDPIDTGDPEQLSLEILRLRDLVRGSEARIGELTTRLARLDEQRKLSEAEWIHRMEHTDRQLEAAIERVDAVESSTSWRVGQLLLTPVRWWRRVMSS
jgi:hypothetical protein